MASRVLYTPAHVDGDFLDGTNDSGNRNGDHFMHQFKGIGVINIKLALVILFAFVGTMIFALICFMGLTLAVAELMPLIYPHGNLCTSGQLAAHSGLLSLPGEGALVNHCGNSSEEARGKDCIFDLSVAAWLPPSCFDAELNADFMALGPWDFYLSNSTEWDLRKAPKDQRILLSDVDAIADSPESMWTDRRYHIVHCAFSWKLMHRAVQRGQKTEETLHSYHHTEHCAYALANTSVLIDAIITRVEISFPKC